MSSAPFDRVAELYHRASNMEPSQRGAWLDQTCGADIHLKNEILSLLRHDDHPHDALHTGGMVELAEKIDVLTGDPPETLGPYRILDTLGEGGMGVVYRAEQQSPIRRMVAIKLVKGFLAGREAILRFESERQTLALMNHANIARVFDAGTTPEGRPYFVMELVVGEPITSYCARHDLGIAERLELLVQVCDGIQHAHRNAIIHRDIKPSNVLVCKIDDHAVPKIIDFGVSKTLDRALDPLSTLTEVGQFLGTPEYVSPEQSRHDGKNVDTRTDVYSLGVLLYELLAGKRPFCTDESGLERLLQRIREEPPTRPSAVVPPDVARHLKRELDWIAIKALEKDPARRYATPADLAADISRYLKHEPVNAGPPGTLYRVGRFVRRHRTAAVVTGVLFSSVIGFTVVTAIQSARIAREAERANKEAAAAAEMVEFTLRFFGAPSVADTAYQMRNGGGFKPNPEEMIRVGLAGRPLLQAQLLYLQGESYRRSGEYLTALPVLTEARDQLSSVAGPVNSLTIDAIQSLGILQLNNRQFDESEKLLTQVYDARVRALGADQPDTLHTMVLLGFMYKIWGRYQDADRWLSNAIDGLSRVLGENKPQTQIARAYLASVLLEQKRYAEAEIMLRDLLVRLPRLAGERHGEVPILFYNLGCAYANLGDRGKSLEYLTTAFEKGFAPPVSLRQDPQLYPLRNDPAIVALDRRIRLNYTGEWEVTLMRAELDLKDGRYDAAERRATELIDAVRRVSNNNVHDSFAPTLILARVRIKQRRFDEAEQILLERLNLAQGNPRVHFSQVVWSLMYLVQCHLGRGERAHALSRAREALGAEKPLAWQGQPRAYYQAMEAGINGDRAAALEYLTLAADRGYSDVEWLKDDLCFEFLHGDPAFKAIVARVASQAL